jgi:hypothetical protein
MPFVGEKLHVPTPSSKKAVGTIAMGRQRSDEDAAIEVFLAWAADDAQVRDWQRTINLRKLLGPRPRDFVKAAKGRDTDAMLVQIKGVLPPRVAEGAAAIIARIEDGKWNTLEGDGDPAKPALDGIRAAHRFGAVVDPSGVHGGPELLKALARLMPPADNRHASFHLGRYEEGDFLAAQDDAAFCAVDAGSKDPARAGQIIKCSRDVAVMLFLSKNRTEAGGGILRDLYYQHRADHKGAAYVPEFNSLVAFHVPREYEITPVLSDDPLLSVFGWYLQEGELYDLKRPDPAAKAAGAAADAAADDSKKQNSRREREKAARRKERAKAKKKEEQSAVPEFLRALAAEREKCRVNREFSRADAIREQCLKAGYRFNAGGKLVKVAAATASDASKEPAAAAAAAPKPQTSRGAGGEGKSEHSKNANLGDVRKSAGAAALSPATAAVGPEGGVAKKKKESKAQRLQRQAKEAALAAAGGTQDPGEGESGSGGMEGKEEKRTGEDAAVRSKRADEGGGEDPRAAGREKKRKKEAPVDGTVSEEGAGQASKRGEEAAKGPPRKRSAADEEVAGSGEEGGEGEESARERKRSKKKGGKAGNAEKLLALSALSTQSKASPGRPAEAAATSAPDAGTGMGLSGAGGGVRGSAEVRGKESAPWGGEGVKGALKKEPKKPKKAKVKLGKEAGGEGGAAEEAASEPQEQRRGKGREVLLARIKNKGWIRPVAPAAQ